MWRWLIVLASATASAAPAKPPVLDFDVVQDGWAVLASGQVACWGPTQGQPHVVAGIEHAIALGDLNAIYAILEDGSVQYLGEKPVGGHVVASDSGWSIDRGGRGLEGLSDARVVEGVDHATALSAGEHHVCFVRKARPLVCTGSNGYGQLGTKPKRAQDNPDLATADQKPAPVVGTTDVVGVAAGSEHTCALHRSGRVECWGSGYQGNLGDGGDQDKGIRRVFVKGVIDAIAIAAAPYGWTTCALRKNGAIRCWGFTYDWMPRGEQERGVELPPLANVLRIRLDNQHICALTEAGEVHCLGTVAIAGPLVDGRVPTITAKAWRKVYP